MATTLGDGKILFGDGSSQNTAAFVNRFVYFTANGSYTVPGNVTKLRIYAIGGGGDGGIATYLASGNTQVMGGGGGGFAFGDITVTSGQVVTANFAPRSSFYWSATSPKGNTLVSINGTVHYRANSGINAGGATTWNNTSNTPGGTAYISGSVSNGGAYTGGSCNKVYPSYTTGSPTVYGGAAAGSPLGSPISTRNSTSYGRALGGNGYYTSSNLGGGGMGAISNSSGSGGSANNFNITSGSTIYEFQNTGLFPFQINYIDPLMQVFNPIGQSLGFNNYPVDYSGTIYIPPAGQGAGGSGISYSISLTNPNVAMRAGNGGFLGGGGAVDITASNPLTNGGPPSVYGGLGGFLGGGGAVKVGCVNSYGDVYQFGGGGGIGGGGGGVMSSYIYAKGGVNYTLPGPGGSPMVIIYPY